MGDVIIKKGLMFLFVLLCLVSFTEGADYEAKSVDINLIYPANNKFYTLSSVDYFNISLTSDYQLDKCWYSLNNELNITFDCFAGDLSVQFNKILNEGNYTFKIYFNTTSDEFPYYAESFKFGVDSLLPRVSFNGSTPENNAKLNHSDFEVSVNITELNLGSVIIELYDNKSELINNFVANPQKVINFYNLGKDGTYVYQVKVNDTFGHGTVLQRTIIIDTTAPEINFTENTLSNYVNVSQNYIFMQVNIMEVYEANITFDLVGPAGLSSKIFTNSTKSMNWTDLLLDGTYTYQVIVCDFVKNCISTEKRTILLDTVYPVMNLISPADKIGFEESDKKFIFDLIDENLVNCVVYLDNLANNSKVIITEGTNSSTDSFEILGLEKGRHIWRIVCTDIAGNIGKSGENSFTVLSEQTYPDGTVSTDLTNVSDTSNVSDFFIGNFVYGTMQWSVPLNLSLGKNYANYINISTKRIELDSIGAPELNYPAKLTMYNVTEKNPRILKNSAVCGYTECPLVYYNSSNGTFVFIVKGFSVYTVDETPFDDGGVSTSGSGGSSGSKSGVSTCKENWKCSEWSECSGKERLRMCIDMAKCGSAYMKPGEKEFCGSSISDTNTNEQNSFIDKQQKTEESKDNAKSITGSVVADVGSGGWSTLKIIVLSVLGLVIAGGYSFNKFREKKEGDALKKDPWGLNDL